MLASTRPINTIVRLITLQLLEKQTAGKRFKVSEALKNAGKRGAKSQFDSIRQKLWHPSNTRPRRRVIFAVKRALNQSCEKVPDLPSSRSALGKPVQLWRVWDGSVCSRGADESVLLRSPPLSHCCSPRRSVLPPARATPSAPLQNRFTKSALWKGCKSLPLAVSKFQHFYLFIYFFLLR